MRGGPRSRVGPLSSPTSGAGWGRMGDTWHLDELFVRIQGRQQYLWRAVDEDGDVIDILVQSRRAALRFFRKLLKRTGLCPSTADHRQTAQLPSGVPHCDAVCGPLHGPVREQSSGSVPPTDPATRAPDAPIQIRCPGATVSLGTRTHSESLAGRPPSPPSGRRRPALDLGRAGRALQPAARSGWRPLRRRSGWTRPAAEAGRDADRRHVERAGHRRELAHRAQRSGAGAVAMPLQPW